jgi:TetR/AcrR family transcriptional regulator, transcriptional repressor of bet genes
MGRLSLKDHRRKELIDAAIASIAMHGLSGTTLATIANLAGVSPGLVNHYFNGKEELLEATLRRLTSDLAHTIRRLTPPQPTPQKRLHAIIDGCLTPEHLRHGAILAWNSFWSHLPTNPRLAKFQRTINRRFRSNMMYALRRMLPEDRAVATYLGLFAMIDGFWLRQVIDPDSFDIAEARRICRQYLDMATRCNGAEDDQDLSEDAHTKRGQ